MDPKNPTLLHLSSLFPTNKRVQEPSLNPFADIFADPLCKLNLKETSEFVRSFSMNVKSNTEPPSQMTRDGLSSSGRQRRPEAPPTPGRPVFSFARIPSRKNIPSKWDDAEKWLISSPSHESPSHLSKPQQPSRFSLNGDRKIAVLLKDKFTDNVVQPARNSIHCVPTKNLVIAMPVEAEVERRDIGTEMTPIGSSTTTRSHTPIDNSSPARHNTPAGRLGALASCSSTSFDISELKDSHFAKLQLGEQYDSMFSNWSTREEEEAEVSKSLRHSEMVGERKSTAESRAAVWKDEKRSKSCIRYQREEARIQAWVNLQSAKAEAESRKLEVKIQKMRSNLEDKLLKKMTIVHSRAEKLRAAAQLQHSQHMLKASEQAHKMKCQQSQFYDHTSCGCFSCNNKLYN